MKKESIDLIKNTQSFFHLTKCFFFFLVVQMEKENLVYMSVQKKVSQILLLKLWLVFFLFVRIFLRQCFFVASFLYFQPKNQLKRARSVSVPEGCLHLQNPEIQNYGENRKQVGITFQKDPIHAIFPCGIKKTEISSPPPASSYTEKHINEQRKSIKFLSYFSLFSHTWAKVSFIQKGINEKLGGNIENFFKNCISKKLIKNLFHCK